MHARHTVKALQQQLAQKNSDWSDYYQLFRDSSMNCGLLAPENGSDWSVYSQLLRDLLSVCWLE